MQIRLGEKLAQLDAAQAEQQKLQKVANEANQKVRLIEKQIAEGVQNLPAFRPGLDFYFRIGERRFVFNSNGVNEVQAEPDCSSTTIEYAGAPWNEHLTETTKQAGA